MEIICKTELNLEYEMVTAEGKVLIADTGIINFILIMFIFNSRAIQHLYLSYIRHDQGESKILFFFNTYSLHICAIFKKWKVFASLLLTILWYINKKSAKLTEKKSTRWWINRIGTTFLFYPLFSSLPFLLPII